MVKEPVNKANPIGIVVVIIVILVVSLAYFLISNKANKSYIEEGDYMVEEQAEQAVEGQLAITGGVYSKSKGTLVIDVWNKGKKEAELEKILLLSGFNNMEKAIEEAPSKAIGEVLKPDGRKSFEIELSELPEEVCAVPASHNPESVGILSKNNIKIEE